ncbi:MAG: transcription-repair coupling factor, partial [Anaerolineae bacterium]|nr:transcription-repair coupling factor [Anaerolineae bacterium]
YAARPYLVAALADDLRRPVLLVMARPDQVNTAIEQLRQWLPTPENVLRFSEPEALPYERIPWAAETVQERLRAIAALAHWKEGSASPIIVTSARALMQPTLPRREFVIGARTLRAGQQINLTQMLTTWLELGYEMVSVVESPGTFSRRGGMIDVYSLGETLPIRIELFGDEIDSLRTFDPTTQRSLERIDEFTLIPATEALPKFGHLAAPKLAALDTSNLHGPASAEFQSDLSVLQNDESFKGIEFYIPYLYTTPGTLLDFMPDNGLVIIDDRSDLQQAVADLEVQALDLHNSLHNSGELPGNFAIPYLTWDTLREILWNRPPLVLGYDQEMGWIEEETDEEQSLQPLAPGAAHQPLAPGAALKDHFVSGPRYGGQLRKVIEAWSEMRRSGYTLVAVTRQAERLCDLWRDQDGQAHPAAEIAAPPEHRTLNLVRGTLDQGWVMRISQDRPPFCLFTDAEIFGWSKPRPRRPRRKPKHPEVFFSDLEAGDYVVHVDYGIGLFQGLVKAAIDTSTEREYLRVDYAENDSIYVPVHHADRLSRYVGSSDRPPEIHRLGTATWSQIKARAKKAALDVARELLELYSARMIVPGYAFSPDTEWQHELEASFSYIETDDQVSAIVDVKADMEKPQPMDRLICGDVGYGKTEVALRAAFKAVMDGKQVAVLVPTTVLAQQHWTTFRRRLAPFPARIEMLSRFRTDKEQRDVVQGLSSGTVDIVIGTHRLLSKDIEFKDLGLLIIDEEQRFGVTHKERLKKMRTEVDVLTMTATPIPRTMYMALTGARDMSTIDTPPEERLPIKTHVGEYDETLVRMAILRELDRGGQVFFVHNRVRGINAVRQQIEQLAPEATYAVGHGQMPERELENVMMDFAEGRIDVLVCTTIIESGLDIPNANTIIVHRADHFGLAQLYQLRGRVGRGANRAYAYFLYDRSAQMTEMGRQRLQAMLEAGELGAGFTIAMRDLEIRGAGDLLGTQQHGHIAAVGFDLYARLLAQAVSELKGESPRLLTATSGEPETGETRAALLPLERQVQITLPLEAAIPVDYVADETLRLQLYRRLAGLATQEDIEAVRGELEDRFGPLPEATQNLLYQLWVKVLAVWAQVDAIVSEYKQIVIRAEALEEIDRAALQSKVGERVRVQRREIRLPIADETVWRAELVRTLELMAEARV